jgi:hypothetical protein
MCSEQFGYLGAAFVSCTAAVYQLSQINVSGELGDHMAWLCMCMFLSMRQSEVRNGLSLACSMSQVNV